MSILQFETFSLASQIARLEMEHTLIRAAAMGMGGKHLRQVLNGISAKISTLRRGKIREEDVIEAQLDSVLGASIGPVSDAGLTALGIGVMEKPGK